VVYPRINAILLVNYVILSNEGTRIKSKKYQCMSWKFYKHKMGQEDVNKKDELIYEVCGKDGVSIVQVA
jgi:hypothetical protein